MNQGTNEDDSQSNPHPEAGLLTSGQEDHHDMVMGAQRGSIRASDKIVKFSMHVNQHSMQSKIDLRF